MTDLDDKWRDADEARLQCEHCGSLLDVYRCEQCGLPACLSPECIAVCRAARRSERREMRMRTVAEPCNYCGATEHAQRVADRDLRIAELEAEVARLLGQPRTSEDADTYPCGHNRQSDGSPTLCAVCYVRGIQQRAEKAEAEVARLAGVSGALENCMSALDHERKRSGGLAGMVRAVQSRAAELAEALREIANSGCIQHESTTCIKAIPSDRWCWSCVARVTLERDSLKLSRMDGR